MRVRALLLAGLATLLMAAPASADTWNVIGTGDGGTCNPDLHTCQSLRAAIAASEATKDTPDTINVPAGTININNDLVIQSDITVIGANARTTIIDGGDKYRGFRVTSTGSAKISHLMITNAAAGQGGSPDGGGIVNLSGVVQLDYVRVTGSRAASGGSGGGIANIEGTLTMLHSLVDNNTAPTGTGGGIVNWGGVESPDRALLGVADSTIFNNSATGSSGAGGIDSRGGQLNIMLINRTTIADNDGGVRGAGGVYATSGAWSGDQQHLPAQPDRHRHVELRRQRPGHARRGQRRERQGVQLRVPGREPAAGDLAHQPGRREQRPDDRREQHGARPDPAGHELRRRR